ncbi:uncharacterized protein [Prorops nasuta]|uniref:uncharacterized protein n=1 Tax=Prorops nasuta TaxID=863751 RepID=UPI0034CEE8EE
MQDRIFDSIDLNAEIERARTTLEAADTAFQRHAAKFDNSDEHPEDVTLAQKIDRTRKLANMDLVPPERPRMKWTKLQKLQDVEPPTSVPTPKPRQNRVNSLVDYIEPVEDPMDSLAMMPMKRKFLTRKKSVSF